MADYLMRDLRHAVRSLLRDRGFTVTTLATLALCLAANAAIFAVVQAVILRPLPFPEPERLVTIENSLSGRRRPQSRQRRARLRRPPARDHRIRGDCGSIAPAAPRSAATAVSRSVSPACWPRPRSSASCGRRRTAAGFSPMPTARSGNTRRCCSATGCGSGCSPGRIRRSARRCGSTAWPSPWSVSCRPTSASCPTKCSCGRPPRSRRPTAPTTAATATAGRCWPG